MLLGRPWTARAVTATVLDFDDDSNDSIDRDESFLDSD